MYKLLKYIKMKYTNLEESNWKLTKIDNQYVMIDANSPLHEPCHRIRRLNLIESILLRVHILHLFVELYE